MLKKTWPNAIVKVELPMIYSVCKAGWVGVDLISGPPCMDVDGEKAKKHIKEDVTILKEDVAA